MNIKSSTTTKTDSAKNTRAAAIERKTKKNDLYNATLTEELAQLKTPKNGKATKRIALTS